VAAATSTGAAWNEGSCSGSIRASQKPGMDESKIQGPEHILGGLDLRLGEDHGFLPRCNSASASTMSMGGVVPISTRDFVLRSDSWAEIERLLLHLQRRNSVRDGPNRRCGHPGRHRHGLTRSASSELSRSFRPTSSCCRLASMPKLRASGWALVKRD
jgi:hypothetical protein